MAALDCQAHTVRGAISGALKTKLGHKVDSSRSTAAFAYIEWPSGFLSRRGPAVTSSVWDRFSPSRRAEPAGVSECVAYLVGRQPASWPLGYVSCGELRTAAACSRTIASSKASDTGFTR